MFLLNHNVPHHWIEEMDDETMTGWVWGAQIFDGTHEWNDIAGAPVEKRRDGKGARDDA